jgi:hypothetical protein
MTRATLAALAALASLALAAAPARAQQGNNSDNSGHYSAGSWGMRSVNELFSRVGNDVEFRSERIGCAIRGAERAWRDSVATHPQTPYQRFVSDLLTVGGATPAADSVTAALVRGAGPGTPLTQAARRLATALNGLMRDRGGCSQTPADSISGRRPDEFPEAPQWQEAIRAYQAYVRNAPDGVFSPPVPELVAIHAALQSVITRALSSPHSRW